MRLGTDADAADATVLDLDRDGVEEIVVVGDADRSVLVLRRDGSFAGLRLDAHPAAVAVGDGDGDARPELHVALRDTDEVAVVHPTGRALVREGSISVPPGPRDLSAGDLDGDGRRPREHEPMSPSIRHLGPAEPVFGIGQSESAAHSGTQTVHQGPIGFISSRSYSE